MGCFLGCFGSSKDVERRKHRRKRSDCSRLEQQSVSSVQDNTENLLSTSSQVNGCRVKPEEQLNLNASTRKKVTFDTNVKMYEPVLVDEVADFQPEKSEEGEEEEALVNSSQLKSCSEDSSVTSTGSYSTNHRYQNCRDSDDEDGEMDYWDGDLTDDDDDDDGGDMQEESDEFGEDFEDGLVCSRARTAVNQVFVEEVEDPTLTCDRDVRSIGLNPSARDRSVYVHPVLNPVENLTQWKAVKAKRAPPLRSQKENCIPSQESRVASSAELSLKESSFSLKSETDPSKKLNQEIVVDASLSNWLASSETTPVKKASSVALYVDTPESSRGSNSVISHEDRPILGAMTVEELKQFAVSSLSRKSPSRSPNEMAIMGTVGTYWKFMGSAEDSGSATSFKGITQRASTRGVQDKRVNHCIGTQTHLRQG